jgi:hypothetical protein
VRWSAVVLVLFTGCGRLGFDRSDSDGGAADACAFGGWSPAQPVTAVNTPGEDWSPTLSDDGLELVLQRGQGITSDLVRSVRASTLDPFPAPTLMTDVNTAAFDGAPWLSHDRLRIYVTNESSGAMRLYRATRATPTATFSALQLVPGLETTIVRGPTLSAAEDEILFTDDTEDAIVRATLDASGARYQIVGPVSELGTSRVGYGELSRDDHTIVFSLDGESLYEATRPAPDRAFSTPRLVPGLDTVDTEGDPDFGDRDRAMVFASDRGTNSHDIYLTTRSCL